MREEKSSPICERLLTERNSEGYIQEYLSIVETLTETDPIVALFLLERFIGLYRELGGNQTGTQLCQILPSRIPVDRLYVRESG